ncbi:MAG: hypothetical protein NC405_05425 [Odoribacter sp.]|nr:hypothetical protein [Odoribacter sp.]
MKRLFYLFIFALPLIGFTACDDDNDLPDVDFIIDISDASYVDGTIYVVAGETFTIDGIKVVNNEKGKEALITYAEYFWDYQRLGVSASDPFAFEIYVSPETPLGEHLLEIYSPVYAVDKTPAFAMQAFNVQVVASASDIPAGGVTSFTAEPSLRDTDPSK